MFEENKFKNEVFLIISSGQTCSRLKVQARNVKQNLDITVV